MALLPERGTDKTMCGAEHCLGFGPSFGKSKVHFLTTAMSIKTVPRRPSVFYAGLWFCRREKDGVFPL